MEIRKVTEADDFQKLGEIYALGWKTAYRGIVPQEYLDQLSGDRWAPLLARLKYETYVVLDRGRYVGTSSIGPARDEDMAGWGELISIYLLPDYFGKGYAAPLFQTAIGALKKRKFSQIYLWVLEENKRARKFYEKQGFTLSGDTAKIVISGQTLVQVKYGIPCVTG